MEGKRIFKNCLFYTGMDVQLYHYDYCTLKGDKWEDREECHCDNCSAYISTSWLKTLGRAIAAEKKEETYDPNKTV